MDNKKILIVDDEAIVRESLQDWLTYAGYEVTIAEDGEMARELVETNNFDIIILDVRLPGKTGIRILREIRETRPLIKSIIITAYPTVELAEEARQLGAIEYLTKPVVPSELEQIVHQALSNS